MTKGARRGCGSTRTHLNRFLTLSMPISGLNGQRISSRPEFKLIRETDKFYTWKTLDWALALDTVVDRPALTVSALGRRLARFVDEHFLAARLGLDRSASVAG